MSPLQSFLTGRDIPMMNENAISNILIDVDFLEEELKRIGRSHLTAVFGELRLVGHFTEEPRMLLMMFRQHQSL
jgi:hypothetical protein